MWAVKLLATLTLAAFTICTPVASSEAAGRHLTTGIATRHNGRPYLRRDIRDLKNNFPDQWNLFILATRAFRQIDASDPLSSYQILGIHGRPYRPWQEAMGVANRGWEGYCPHGTAIFLTWHRPYVALYEQELFKQVRIIAETASTNRARWLAAADAFRMPYFDVGLGAKAGELPDFFTSPHIQVTGPNGVPNVIPNPLFQYDFQPVFRQDFTDKWTQWNHTMRYPTTNGASAQSQPDKFRSEFYNFRSMYQNELGKCFQQKTFNGFATALENFHGWFHALVGGYGDLSGHFWPVEYSAFEPIFMLHHANVDRLLALFQAMHPETWFEPADSGSGGLWAPAHITVDANWGLQPFWKNEHSFYTSYDVRDTAVFGYAYPETQAWDYASEDSWRRAVTAYVAWTYPMGARAMLTENGAESAGGFSHLLTNSTFTDWSIAITASTKRLPGTFHVEFVFAGRGSNDADTAVVGQWMQLMPQGTNEDWKSHSAESKTKRFSTLEPTKNGTVSLTMSLIDQAAAGLLASLDADAVVPYLQEHLGWRVTGENGTPFADNDLDAFVLDIVSANVRIPEDASQMLEYDNEVTSHPEVMGSKRRLPFGNPICRWPTCGSP